MATDWSLKSEKRPSYQGTFFEKIAVVFGLGFMPKAPGTWGSIPGVFLSIYAYHLCLSLGGGDSSQILQGTSLFFALCFLILLTLLSWLSIYKTEKLWRTHDDKSIVIDEVAGQVVTLIWFPPSWQVLLAGFVLFRFFDIVKPGPIAWIDRELSSSFGTLFDDIIAGVFAAAVLGVIWKYFL